MNFLIRSRSGLVVCLNLLLLGFTSSAIAATRPVPKTKCEILENEYANCKMNLKRSVVSCLSDTGEYSPAQWYCLLTLLPDGPGWFPQPDISSSETWPFQTDGEFAEFVNSCTEAYSDQSIPNAPLTLTYEKLDQCIQKVYSMADEKSLNRTCRRTHFIYHETCLSAAKPKPLGNPVDENGIGGGVADGDGNEALVNVARTPD